MSDARGGVTEAELRRAFDATFAAPVDLGQAETCEILAVRTHGRLLALRASEIAGIMICPTVVPVPAERRALRGVAGVRGSIVAVYSLGAMLGEGVASAAERWLVLHGSDRSAGISFEDLDGYERIPVGDIRLPRDAEDGKDVQLVNVRGTDRVLVDLPRLMETIRGAAHGPEGA